MTALAINGGEAEIQYELPTVKNTSGRDLGKEELELVTEVIQTGNLGFIYGTKIKQFQSDWASRYGVKTAVAVSSGTASLHTAMIFLDIKEGDEVLVPAITDMGTIIAVLLQKATPVFIDVDLNTQNMDPNDLEEKITSKTKAIIPVHLFGFPCDMDPIMEIAKKHGLFVVEDCCQAHLTEYKGKLVGTIGDVGCFSFQQSKHMTTGDGGMVITNSDEMCGRRLMECADKGWPRDKYRDHLFLAPNYHMTELQAAVGIAQFRKLDGFIDKRRKSATLLSSLIEDIDGIYPPPETDWAKNTYYEYALTIDPDQFTVSNVELARALSLEGLQTVPSYLPYPIYMYQVVNQSLHVDFKVDMCPVAAKACHSMLFIPWNEKMTEQHARDVAAAIRKVLLFYKK